MEEQLISFETAKLAKEKGFNIGCKNKYVETLEHALEMGRGGDCTFPHIPTRVLTNSSYEKWDIVHCDAPTQSLLAKWLREVHKINIFISSKTIENKTIFIPHGRTIPDTIKNNLIVDIIQYCTNNTYEEALEIALFEALKLI